MSSRDREKVVFVVGQVTELVHSQGVGMFFRVVSLNFLKENLSTGATRKKILVEEKGRG